MRILKRILCKSKEELLTKNEEHSAAAIGSVSSEIWATNPHSQPVNQQVDRYKNLTSAVRKQQRMYDDRPLSMDDDDDFSRNNRGVERVGSDFTKWLSDDTDDDTDDGCVSPYCLQTGNDNTQVVLPTTVAQASKQVPKQVYLVRQRWPWCSGLFSIAQTIILGFMMVECGMAPFELNPMCGPFPDALSEWGGKNSALILLDNQFWRLLTPTFLHAGVIHLVANLAIQLTSGAFMEKEWGSWRWLVVYLTSAVGSNVLSVIFLPQAVSVGSSGAVMGLFGGKLSEVLVHKLVEEHPETTRDAVAQAARRRSYESVTTSVLVILLFSFVPFVDWAAHLGGLVSGFLIGIGVFGLDLDANRCLQIFVSWCGLVATAYFFFKTLRYMYQNTQDIPELHDVCGYYKKSFESYECNCMLSEMNLYGTNGDSDHDKNDDQNDDVDNSYSNLQNGGNAYNYNQNGNQYAQNSNYYSGYGGDNAANYNGGYDSYYAGNNYDYNYANDDLN